MNDIDKDREGSASEPVTDSTIIPVVEEEIVTEARAVKTGSVRVQKHVEKTVKRVDLPLSTETVEIRRVQVNRVVAIAPSVRRDGATIIVPVVEEELVVTKRLILKEEIHLIKTRKKTRTSREVTLERERAEIRRLDAHGRIIDAPGNRAGGAAPAKRSRTVPGGSVLD